LEQAEFITIFRLFESACTIAQWREVVASLGFA
jgi:hypothetical protein